MSYTKVTLERTLALSTSLNQKESLYYNATTLALILDPQSPELAEMSVV